MARKKRRTADIPPGDGSAQPRTAGLMPVQAPDLPLQTALAVSETATLNDVAVVALAVKRADNVGDTELRVHFAQKANGYGTNGEHGQLVVKPTFSVSAFKLSDDESNTEPCISIEATFAVLYACENVGRFSPENLEAFANTNAVFNVWPFWRELVMSISTRMRISPIVVPMLRP
jgi:hypothetical protein